jgi:hypothetical protein
MSIELPEDMIDVALDCPNCNNKLLGNFLVCRSTSHPAEYFQLALTQLLS